MSDKLHNSPRKRVQNISNTQTFTLLLFSVSIGVILLAEPETITNLNDLISKK